LNESEAVKLYQAALYVGAEGRHARQWLEYLARQEGEEAKTTMARSLSKIPVQQSTPQITEQPVVINAAQQLPSGAMHPSELPRIRVTTLQTFEKCPYRWAAENLYKGQPRVDSPYAKIGTAVHKIVEGFLMQAFGGAVDDEGVKEAWKIVPPNERQNIAEYLKSFGNLGVTQALVVEERYTMPLVEGMPDISGQTDFVYESGSETIVVHDHKTNRRREDVMEWKSKLQPLVYGLLIRREFPGYKRYMFSIGYVNAGQNVSFELTAQDEQDTYVRLRSIWAEMQQYATDNSWPQRLNDECSYCPLADTCSTKSSAMREFKASVPELLTADSLVPRYNYVQALKTIVDAELEVVKLFIKQELAARGGNWTAPTGDPQSPFASVSLYEQLTRKVEYRPILAALNTWGAQIDQTELVAAADDMCEMFTVKIGGVDNFCKKHPSFKPFLENIVVKTPSENGPSIKMAPVAKVVA
jgi:RecB family exonuclease